MKLPSKYSQSSRETGRWRLFELVCFEAELLTQGCVFHIHYAFILRAFLKLAARLVH